MSSFLKKPWVQKVPRYTAAYTFAAAMALLGLVLALRLHTTIMDVLAFFSVRTSTALAFRNWGAFFLFLGYAVFIALLEPYMNKAAAEGQVLRRAAKVAVWEVGVLLLTFLVPLLLDLIWRLR